MLTLRVKKLYYKNFLRRDFAFIEKGLCTNRSYLVAGDLLYRDDKLLLKKPKMIIGSDKTELMEFLGRKREHWYMNIRNFIKLAVGVTFLHVLLIRVPYIFENWFGDNFKPDQKDKQQEDKFESKNMDENNSSE